jgi:hypothetical protein
MKKLLIGLLLISSLANGTLAINDSTEAYLAVENLLKSTRSSTIKLDKSLLKNFNIVDTLFNYDKFKTKEDTIYNATINNQKVRIKISKSIFIVINDSHINYYNYWTKANMKQRQKKAIAERIKRRNYYNKLDKERQELENKLRASLGKLTSTYKVDGSYFETYSNGNTTTTLLNGKVYSTHTNY